MYPLWGDALSSAMAPGSSDSRCKNSGEIVAVMIVGCMGWMGSGCVARSPMLILVSKTPSPHVV